MELRLIHIFQEFKKKNIIYMSQYLNFYLSIKDPEFKSSSVEIPNDVPNNYISRIFISTPIYDSEFKQKIGYKVSNDYIQQVSENEYIVTIYSTYYIYGQGTISWQYSFLNDKPSYYYPVGILAVSNITSTTGTYYGKTGVVSLTAYEDGKRDVTVGFNF